jgi:uncharacterized protein (TIGR00299 family) protein
MGLALHFDCFSGISGDMTLGALVDCGIPAEPIQEGVASLGLPVTLHFEKVRKGGLAATQAWVQAPEEKAHRYLPDIEEALSRGKLTPSQKALALRIFRRLAEAEAEVHGMPVDRVHFHEVGALDSIVDIVGAAIALDLLGAEHISSRSVPTGHGTVKCEHGLMPIPAPATAALLRGAPLAPSPIRAELTTPTGAAILAATVQEWVETPSLTLERIGHGAGTKDFLEQPNLLRVLAGSRASPPSSGFVWVIEANLDDVPGEVVGYSLERLFAAGALDAYTVPVQMKKGRPGVLLGVLAPPEKKDTLVDLLFRETGTFGVRYHRVERATLSREPIQVTTPWGPVAAKRGWREGLELITPEFEDCARVARERGVPLRDVYAAVTKAR